ncbi:hypothetical protein KZY42_004267 [Vibrio vulnificus]|uniref:hypothetical protein n=1 Tax=Vibrionaceae TaxID=641 RepID=UPI00076AB6AF|nr:MULTISPECIES: hypothetical protein [Vibrionaceae]EGR0209290.1 hypothetical protein [Vibrio vulnificus]EHU9446779.1 hypothetical protein [Vibrio vulnificus]MCA3912573.1 hypothetical protein [Vibrio vulnificus]MCU8501594.1 hypothetical protein [Vibrio vulnificus]RZP95552.1 hypothetical protein D8T65_24400 [Vibrio vulnificus]
MKNPFETQQTRARKEFKALGRAEKNDVKDSELIQEMTKDMKDPDSAESVMQAAAAVMYMKAVKKGDTPITDATNRILKRKRAETKAMAKLKPQPE